MGPESDHTELNAKKWDARASTYDQKRFDYFRYMQSRLIPMLPLHEKLSFLDIGCGTGWAVRQVARGMNQRGTFGGIDISANMLEKARVSSLGDTSVCFQKANAEHLPFPDYHLDLIICTNSFHHYLHPVQALGEIFRVLKVEGRIYILDVTADDFITKTVDQVVQRREAAHVKFCSTGEYRRFFTEAQLVHIASRTIMVPLKVHIGEKG